MGQSRLQIEDGLSSRPRSEGRELRTWEKRTAHDGPRSIRVQKQRRPGMRIPGQRKKSLGVSDLLVLPFLLDLDDLVVFDSHLDCIALLEIAKGAIFPIDADLDGVGDQMR